MHPRHPSLHPFSRWNVTVFHLQLLFTLLCLSLLVSHSLSVSTLQFLTNLHGVSARAPTHHHPWNTQLCYVIFVEPIRLRIVCERRHASILLVPTALASSKLKSKFCSSCTKIRDIQCPGFLFLFSGTDHENPGQSGKSGTGGNPGRKPPTEQKVEYKSTGSAVSTCSTLLKWNMVERQTVKSWGKSSLIGSLFWTSRNLSSFSVTSKVGPIRNHKKQNIPALFCLNRPDHQTTRPPDQQTRPPDQTRPTDQTRTPDHQTRTPDHQT